MSQLKLFVVIEADRVIYSAGSIDEGLAFMEGRGAGVLYRLLCGPREIQDSVHPKKRRKPAENKSPGHRRAS